MYSANGPPKGANVTSNQDSYDLIFKDVVIRSENRNKTIYPNPNNFTVNFRNQITKIYKAELISVNVPAATDMTVNITNSTNRLYFIFTGISGYVEIQAGTYLNPSSVAIELSRQFGLVIPANTITVTYNVNLNRYLFIDSALISGQLTLYPINGTSTGGAPVLVVQNSIGPSLKLLNAPMNVTQPINIDTLSGNLVVAPAVLGDYGNYNGVDVPINNFAEKIFGNTIASDVVLVECSIYLSLGQLNGDTLILPPDESGENKNIPPIFCQVPNNTIVGSQFTKTLLSQPSVWSGVQFYNPPVSTVNKLDVRWYDEKGVLIDILDNCFTLRIYYFQKRNGTTAFSTSVFNYAASGTIDSNFSNN